MQAKERVTCVCVPVGMGPTGGPLVLILRLPCSGDARPCAPKDGGGKAMGSDLGWRGAGSLAALDRISLSGWHQGESDNCSRINKSFLQNGLAGRFGER